MGRGLERRKDRRSWHVHNFVPLKVLLQQHHQLSGLRKKARVNNEGERERLKEKQVWGKRMPERPLHETSAFQ